MAEFLRIPLQGTELPVPHLLAGLLATFQIAAGISGRLDVPASSNGDVPVVVSLPGSMAGWSRKETTLESATLTISIITVGQGSSFQVLRVPEQTCGLSRASLEEELRHSTVASSVTPSAGPRLPQVISFRRSVAEMPGDTFNYFDTTIRARFSRPANFPGASVQAVLLHPGSQVFSGVAEFAIAKNRKSATWRSSGDWRSDIVWSYWFVSRQTVTIDCRASSQGKVVDNLGTGVS